MPGRMEAEIVTGVDHVERVIARFTELGFELEVIHWADKETVTVVAVTVTALSEIDFFHYVNES
jgi:hypothetical protein